MNYPLVGDLAADGIPVTVTCRVLKIARQPYYRWLADPVMNAELDEVLPCQRSFRRSQGRPRVRLPAPARRGLRCRRGDGSQDGVAHLLRQSVVVRISVRSPARTGKKPGPPVHGDLCAITDDTGRVWHEFTADTANQLWVGDITEHQTREGKLYVCAFKDVFSNRIVGYSIDSRMKSKIARSVEQRRLSPDATIPPDAWFTPVGARNFEAGSSFAR